MLEVRVANLDEIYHVWQLTHDEYVRQGYIQPRPEGVLVHYPHLELIPETVVLVALDDDGKIVGTNSYTRDGPRGLHVDEDFREATDRVRAEGLKVAASWRIITRPQCRQAIRVVLELMRATERLMRDCGDEVLLCTFHPRHAQVYERLCGLRVIAESADTVNMLTHAPAVLMRGDISTGTVRRG